MSGIKKIKAEFLLAVAVLLTAFSLCGCGDKEKKTEESTIPVDLSTIKVEHLENPDGLMEGSDGTEIAIEITGDPNIKETEEDDRSEPEGTEEDTPDEDGAGQDEAGNEDEGSDTTDEEESLPQESVAVSVTPGGTANIAFDKSWKYADFSEINSGSAVMYYAADNRKNKVIGVNAGHGTKGGTSVKTYSHPDKTPKTTGGTNPEGAVKSVAVSSGMAFKDGTSEAAVALREAQILRDRLLAAGYDVLMIRDGSDVQLDNVARTVLCNNVADCHIALHWDGDGLDYDKGCFFISTPEGIKGMDPVASTWQKSESLGRALISGLSAQGCKINGKGEMKIDLTQTSFSTVPSVDIELGNAASAHDDATLAKLADGLVQGINSYFP